MSDGTSLNAKLAAMMPIDAGGMEGIEEEPLTPLSPETVYTVTVTPGSNWYGFASNTAGEKGATLEVVEQLGDSDEGYVLVDNIYAVENPDDLSSPESELYLHIGPPDGPND